MQKNAKFAESTHFYICYFLMSLKRGILDVKLARSLISCSLPVMFSLLWRKQIPDSRMSVQDIAYFWCYQVTSVKSLPLIFKILWRKEDEGVSEKALLWAVFVICIYYFFRFAISKSEFPISLVKLFLLYPYPWFFNGTTTVLMIKVNDQIIFIFSVFLSSELSHAGN